MSRLSVNINDETSQALAELAARRGTTITEIVRRSVSVYKYIDDQKQQGRRVSTTNQVGGDVEYLAIL